MTTLPEFSWMLPFFLYAETHYRFRYFFSYLRKREPEVIVDAPHRIEPGHNIPLLILVKDADRYPATLMRVAVTVQQAGKVLLHTDLVDHAIPLAERLWWKVYEIPRTSRGGAVQILVTFDLAIGTDMRSYVTDNHRTSSHSPLEVYLADEPLPRLPGMHFGDPHTHSDRTDDQVEFGVPIQPAVALARPMGLLFFAVTDHSYDLDDAVDDYTTNDPSLPKWYSLLSEIRLVNETNRDFTVLQGEEVSCRNNAGQNVHLLLYGDHNFFPGSGDSAERWLRTYSEHTVTEILTLKDPASLAFAAHPLESVSFLQRLLLGRGTWAHKDLTQEGLAGIQFANGIHNSGFTRGYQAWIRTLLRGRKVFCLAGNDAHGNFNRFRQIGVPFFKIREHHSQLFGKMRTAVFVHGTVNQSSLMQTLRSGNFVCTDGPVINISLRETPDVLTSIGRTIQRSEPEFDVTLKSTAEFGSLSELRIFSGIIGRKDEHILLSEHYSGSYDHRRSFSVSVVEPMYIRAEVSTSEEHTPDSSAHFCITNPVWLLPPG